ncbi:hypothetical protein UY3_01790 [Chelonia mydas]|uniref:Uncharacterized protein n=1 Tax=Chelonia mydas TaxID=8469 RepID=M7C8P2_CHEMY|nr:hypothetical protein UY3_01790 [Chelonia mydas]
MPLAAAPLPAPSASTSTPTSALMPSGAPISALIPPAAPTAMPTALAWVSSVPAQRGTAPSGLATARDPQDSRDPLGVDGREQPRFMGVSSSSSPDEVLEGTAIAPALEDNRVLQQLLQRVAQFLGIQAEVVQDVDPMGDVLAPSRPAHIALPLIKTISDTTKTLWQTLSSLLPTAKHNAWRYFVPCRGYEHLYSHPPPDSLVMDAANQRERQGYQGPSPKNREVKRLDLFGRKVYSTSRLQLHISNQQAIVSRYWYNTCGAMAKFAELLPQDSHAEFSAFVNEGKLISQASLQAALDGADAATRVMATGVAMRRGAWLQVFDLPYKVQQTIQIQDLPFEGVTLFSEKTDKRLHSLKDSRATLKSLGLHTPATQWKHFRPQPPPRFFQQQN